MKSLRGRRHDADQPSRHTAPDRTDGAASRSSPPANLYEIFTLRGRFLTRSSRRSADTLGGGANALLLLQPKRTGTPASAPWGLRLKVWWSRGRLDRELAAGESPTRRPDLRLRADQLTSGRYRTGLAAVLRNLVEAADEPPGLLERQAPARALNRIAVRRIRDDLLALAERLAGDEPIAPHVAARADLLAFDESGPLYGAAAPEAVEASIDAVRVALGGAGRPTPTAG